MKLEYICPAVDIVEFPVEDVITTSLEIYKIYNDPEAWNEEGEEGVLDWN